VDAEEESGGVRDSRAVQSQDGYSSSGRAIGSESLEM